MMGFHHTDPRYPFLWEDTSQPAGRWHPQGEGPVQYFCDTPDGAWAEFVRHEEITEPQDLRTIRRALWAVDLGEEPAVLPALPFKTLTGGPHTYETCQEEARRLRGKGATKIVAPSAALLPGDERTSGRGSPLESSPSCRSSCRGESTAARRAPRRLPTCGSRFRRTLRPTKCVEILPPPWGRFGAAGSLTDQGDKRVRCTATLCDTGIRM